MTAPLRLALAQLNAHVGHLEKNAQAIVDALTAARKQGATLVLFPELMISGYPPEDLLFKSGFLHAARRTVESLIPHTKGLTAIIGFPELADDVYNSAAVLHDGALVGIHRKWFLPNYGVFDENRYFQAGREATVFERPDVRFGTVICEDIWYPGGPAHPLSLWGGAQLVAAINASPFNLGQGEHRDHMLATRAADYTAAIAYV
ncbi:MAG: NAD+ synthase, partial [Candidatus Sericytochromatia bacterium]|nr:NAD+ synthase [Candidatus Sericytochromatia bacterium]